MKTKNTRRQFLKRAAFAAVGLSVMPKNVLSQAAENQAQKTDRLKLGLASYTFRKFTTDQAVDMTKRVALNYICLKEMHLPLDSSPEQIEKVTTKIKETQLTLYAGGVIYMNNEADVNRAFDYARQAKMTTIVGVPRPELLELVNKKVQDYDIKVAVHNHGPEDKLYPTPASVYEKIQQLDRRIGLCIDIGHTRRAGADPSESAEKFADRLLDVHIKDVSAAAPEGQTVEIGRGVIDIPAFLKTLLKINYRGIAAFEYEKDENDPLPGLAESVGYVKGALAAV